MESKRLFDLVAGLAALAILLPVFLVIFLIVRLASKGPGFFSQERIGLHGRTFRVLKFRTMVDKADQIGPFRTEKDDPRITRFGKFLRTTSLDELPQLFNVVKGDMSIVGPRPDSPQQRCDYTDEEWRSRASTRPGITGLAQVYGRSNVTAEERKNLDLEYTRTRTFLLDIKIIAMTICQLLKGGSW